MKNIPGYLLILASWMQSTHVLPWVSWHSELLALAALAWFAGVRLLEQKRLGEKTLAFPMVAWAPVVLGLYALIQFAWGQIDFFGDALMISLYMAACAVALAVGYQWGAKSGPGAKEGRTETALGQLAIAVLAGAVLSACIMLAQALGVWEAADWIVRSESYRRPGGNIGQPNHMATLLLMGMASLAYLFERRRLGPSVTVMLQFLLVLALAMTESRTGLLSAAALTAWWFFRRALFSRAGTVHPIAWVWVGLLLLVWIWPTFIAGWHFSGAEGGVRINAGVGVRSVVWSQLLEAVMLHPWAGWGLREVSEAHNAVLHLHREGAPFSYAHNLVLDLALGLGVPLTLLVLVACARWIWGRMRSATTLASWYGLAMLIPLGIHSMLEFPYSYAYFLVPVLLAIGVMEAEAARDSVRKIRLSYASAGAGLLFLVLAWSAVEYVAIEEDFRVARFEALHVGQTPGEYTIPDIKLLTQLEAMLKATRTRPAPGMDKDEIELLRRAAMRFPWTAIQNRYALSLALNGNPDEAIRQMQVMRAMHGEKHYEGIKASWELQAEEKYPQLKNVKLP